MDREIQAAVQRPTGRLEPLGAERVADVARILAAAFVEDPAYSYLFLDRSERARGLEDFFARNLRAHLPYECTYVWTDATPAATTLGTVTVRPPGGIPLSLWTMLRHGLLPFAASHGRRAVQRLFRLKAVYDEIEADLAHGEPHFYVHMMAVAPDHQGQGVGSRLLSEAMSRSRERATAANATAPTAAWPTAAWPIVLTTNLARNEPFYRRAGFETVEVRSLRLDPTVSPYPVWCMRRD